MAIINPPPADAVDMQNAAGGLVAPREGWRNFFQGVYIICEAVSSSGITAKRPTKLLWVGRTFFDTTLALPIWYDGTGWIDAAGNPV